MTAERQLRHKPSAAVLSCRDARQYISVRAFKIDVRFAQQRNAIDALDDTDQRRYVLLRNRRQMAERPSPLLSQP